MRTLATSIFVISFAAAAPGGTQTLSLAGTDHSGHISMSCLKNWITSAQAAAGLPDYPYFEKPEAFGGQGVWTSLVAEPLSPSAVYPESADFTVFNTSVDDMEAYNERNIGWLEYDDTPLTGAGIETVPVSLISIVVDGAAFSPINSTHNAGGGLGNAGWDYLVSCSNLTGSGITFRDGFPISLDIQADVSVTVRFGAIPGGELPVPYLGTVAMTGNEFAFDVDVTQDNDTPLEAVEDTRLVFNRRGTVDAVVRLVCDDDINADGVRDVEDLYALNTSLTDIDGDGLANLNDARCLTVSIRGVEVADTLTPCGP